MQAPRTLYEDIFDTPQKFDVKMLDYEKKGDSLRQPQSSHSQTSAPWPLLFYAQGAGPGLPRLAPPAEFCSRGVARSAGGHRGDAPVLPRWLDVRCARRQSAVGEFEILLAVF